MTPLLSFAPSDFMHRLRPVRMSRRVAAFATGLLAITFIAVSSPTEAMGPNPLPLPIVAPSTVISAGQELVFSVDLGTIPERPELVVNVTPSNPNPLMEIQIQITNWSGLPTNPGCPGGGVYDGGPTFTSAPTLGPNTLTAFLRFCEPRISGGFWANGTVDVLVRVLDFGTTSSPAKIDIDIRGETQVPTAEHFFEVLPDPGPQTLTVNAFRDTVLYQAASSYNNGSGRYLWSGQDYTLFQFGQVQIPLWRRLNSLIAFSFLSSLPSNAVIDDADLRLYSYGALGGGGSVQLFETAPDSTGDDWNPGTEDAPGTEFVATTPSSSGANWFNRRGSNSPWATPGGDVTGGALTTRFIAGSGFQTFSSNALTDAVQAMVDDQDDRHGFTLRGPFTTFFSGDRGVRFGSGQDPTSTRRPQLEIDWSVEGPYSEGAFTSGTVVFIGEGEDFRWQYDLDEDDLFVTDINGVCEITSDTNPDYPALLPYAYTYMGNPGFVGVDCCSWLVDSPQTGTVGAGQALFFHGLDPAISSNVPPDSDGDGMRDPCDNCVNIPNGPALGSCIGLAGTGSTCRSDHECGQYEFCSLSQEDADFDFTGDACSVPEPGLGAGLALGVIWSMMWAGVRTRRAAH